MVKKVIHIADLHIPNMEDQRPYSEMLKQLSARIYQQVKGQNPDEFRIVIVGDIYQNKIKTSNEARTMFHTFLNYLNQMRVMTYIVAGNHDLLENNVQNREDSLRSTFIIRGAYPRIKYLDKELGYKSGLMEDDNVIWALYSIHDMYRAPKMDGLREKNPDKTIIGLYHGEIVGATNDGGRLFDGGIDPLSYAECDCVMAGHIHKHQEVKKNGVPLVYSGSVFQQNGGENISRHGFLVWNLEDMSYQFHEVPNDYRIFRLQLNSYEDISNDVERLLNL